jgi:hypothetical protein
MRPRDDNGGGGGAAAGGQARVPGTVRVIAWLAILLGIVELIGGIALVATAIQVTGASKGAVTFLGIAAIVAGAVHVVVGRGLLRRNVVALLFALLVTGLKAIADAIWIILEGVDGVGISAPVALAVSAVAFALLWRARSAFPGGV